MLHLISNSQNQINIKNIIYFISKKDNIILFSEGVILGLVNSSTEQILKEFIPNVYILNQDIKIRNISLYIPSYFKKITYIKFVNLVKINKTNITW